MEAQPSLQELVDNPEGSSDFIWDFGKLPFPTHLGKYLIKIGKIRAKIHEIGKIKAIFGLGMTPIYGLKNGQIKSLGSQGRMTSVEVSGQEEVQMTSPVCQEELSAAIDSILSDTEQSVPETRDGQAQVCAPSPALRLS